jgi:type II secretory pathway pseudopilin PulG
MRDVGGFTLLEIILVLFLLAGLLGLIVPRLSIGDNLGSAGRRWVGALKSFQEMAMGTQKTVRLYIDLDKGIYWPMVIDGNQEKVPIDATWATPSSLPESVRFSDVQVGALHKTSGRAEFFFYSNGRIDPATIHLTDAGNNVMGILIEPTTSLIRVTDQRIEPSRPWTIPERIRPLLLPGSTGSQSPLPLGVQK